MKIGYLLVSSLPIKILMLKCVCKSSCTQIFLFSAHLEEVIKLSHNHIQIYLIQGKQDHALITLTRSPLTKS